MGASASRSLRAPRNAFLAAVVLVVSGVGWRAAAQPTLVSVHPREPVESLRLPLPRRQPPPQPTTHASASLGVPDRGTLRDAVELDSEPDVFVRDTRRSATYGTGELVGLIRRSAAAVGRTHPGPPLVVGDLSRQAGGRISPHRSHRSGRDADIGFYLLDEQGRSAPIEQFVRLRRDGCGRIGESRYCFDAARNWALISAMVSDPVARIQYVLVARDLAARLVEEGERQGATPELLARVRTVTEPHTGSSSHRSHFHVRIYCPVDDRPGCVDEPPYHAWYEGEPPQVPATIQRHRARTRRAANARTRRIRARARSRRARN